MSISRECKWASDATIRLDFDKYLGMADAPKIKIKIKIKERIVRLESRSCRLPFDDDRDNDGRNRLENCFAIVEQMSWKNKTTVVGRACVCWQMPFKTLEHPIERCERGGRTRDMRCAVIFWREKGHYPQNMAQVKSEPFGKEEEKMKRKSGIYAFVWLRCVVFVLRHCCCSGTGCRCRRRGRLDGKRSCISRCTA